MTTIKCHLTKVNEETEITQNHGQIFLSQSMLHLILFSTTERKKILAYERQEN